MTEIRAIDAVGLTKRYGEVAAVDRLTFTVRPGEIYALLGLNGAGKTTTIRMLLGMVRPTEGQVSLLGAKVRPGALSMWSLVGYLVETPAAYPDLTVTENLQVAARLRGLIGDHAVSSVITRLGLSAYAGHRARTLSLGNAQRLGLAKALIHRPDLLILDRAHTLGLLGTKAALTGSAADWPAYFALLAQAVAVGGVVVFGLVVVWMFGREFSQGTAKDLLALPTARTTIVGAKFAVATAWCLLLGLYLYLLGLPIGALVGLPGWSLTAAAIALAKLLATTAMTILLVTPFALAASAGRGYLAGIAAMITAVFLAQVIALLGYGRYFPWSVPALFTDLAGPDRDPPGVLGFVLVALVGVAGIGATAAWWRRADQDR